MTRYLIDADTNESIGPATPEQIAASDNAGDTGIILIDADGDVVAPQDEHLHQPRTAQPVRRAYVEQDDGADEPRTAVDTSPDHLTVTRTDRGFARLPEIPGTHGSSVRVYESSNAEGPHLWLATGAAKVQLPVAEAVKLAEQILLLARGHYQGTTGCDQCAGTVTEHESHCTRGR